MRPDRADRRWLQYSVGAAILMGLLLAACGSNPVANTPTSALDGSGERASNTPRPARTATPGPSPTPTRTPTSTATPTRTPTATPGPGLDELMGTPNALAAAAQLDQASAAFQELAELYPHRAEPWLGLAGIALRVGDAEAALEYFEAAVDADPANRDAYRQWALLLEQQGRYDEVLEVYHRMVAQFPGEPDLLIARAITAARLGRDEEAIADLQAAQSLDPYLHFAWLNAAAAASAERHYDASIEIATAGLEAHPDSVSLYLERGLAFLSLGQREPALEDFNAAVDLDELSYSAFHWRGRTLDQLGHTEEAIADLQQAGELGVLAGVAGITEAYEAMADAADVMARSGDVDGAFEYLAGQVITHGSQDALLMGYARVDWRRGSTDLALSRLDSLVRDGYIPAFYWRAVILIEAEGAADQAMADLYAFLSVRRSGPEAEAARLLLEQLGADPDAPFDATPGAPTPPPPSGGDDD